MRQYKVIPQTFFVLLLAVLIAQCRSNETAKKKDVTQPTAQSRSLDSNVASIGFEPTQNGYRFFLQFKGEGKTNMISRCMDWSMNGLQGAKGITSLEYNEDACNDESHPLAKSEAFLRLVGRDSQAIIKDFGEDLLPVLSAAKGPVLLLENIQHLDQFNSFLEMPQGKIHATMTFHSDDSCQNRGGIVEGCEKREQLPGAAGTLRLRLEILVKEGHVEINKSTH